MARSWGTTQETNFRDLFYSMRGSKSSYLLSLYGFYFKEIIHVGKNELFFSAYM